MSPIRFRIMALLWASMNIVLILTMAGILYFSWNFASKGMIEDISYMDAVVICGFISFFDSAIKVIWKTFKKIKDNPPEL